MKKNFDKEYYLSHRGCYDKSKMEKLIDNNPHSTIQEFLQWAIHIKDKFYFVKNYCDLSLQQKGLLYLRCGKLSMEICEKSGCDCTKLKICIEAIENYIFNRLDEEELRKIANSFGDLLHTLTPTNSIYYSAAYSIKYLATFVIGDNDLSLAVNQGVISCIYGTEEADLVELNGKDYYKNRLFNLLVEFCENQ